MNGLNETLIPDPRTPLYEILGTLKWASLIAFFKFPLRFVPGLTANASGGRFSYRTAGLGNGTEIGRLYLALFPLMNDTFETREACAQRIRTVVADEGLKQIRAGSSHPDSDKYVGRSPTYKNATLAMFLMQQIAELQKYISGHPLDRPTSDFCCCSLFRCADATAGQTYLQHFSSAPMHP